MSHKVVRASKFRNVFGTAWKKERCFTNIRVSKSTWDSTFCSVNPKFLAVIVESAGGGAFIVIKLSSQDKAGKIKSDHPVVSGHKGPVLDLAWSFHNDNLIASGSEDCSVRVWLIPDEGLTKTLTDSEAVLLYHQRRVGLVLWHPTAENVLLTAGSDNLVVIWDVGTSSPNIVIESHPDVVYSASWNWDGSKLLTTCRDKKIRVLDPRTGIIEDEAVCHDGTKPCRAVFLRNGQIFTTGSSKSSERQFSLRESHNLNEPLAIAEIDTSNGVLFPLYDPDTSMVYLCGKGDSVIRYFEVTAESPYVHFISTFQSPDPQRGICMMPKRGCNVAACEIARFYRLNSSGLCQVISMTVPRKSELYQEDLYPSTLSPLPALSADEWFSGRNENPLMMDVKTGCPVSAMEENDNDLLTNSHPKLRRSSLPMPGLCHPLLAKTQSLPVDNRSHHLKEEIMQLRSIISELEQRLQKVEEMNLEERIRALETRKCSCCSVITPNLSSGSCLYDKSLDCQTESVPEIAGSVVSSYRGTSVLSAIWNSPMSSLSSLGSQLSSPLSSAYSLGMPAMTPLRALSTWSKWVSPLQSISSYSSTLMSSISPIYRASAK